MEVVQSFGVPLEAHCQESCTLMMKSMPGLPKLRGSVWDRNGIRLDTKLSLQSCGAANTIICMRNVDCLPTVRQKIEPLPYKLS